ncbi:hypothetical protein RND71_020028 [Anisodus tanguticus]|uniref:Uncharacterized protein n=1 Tax=Anisodus tanguticus TaxID=243964 RepID=A0AAE1VEZ6_9SOLA|nr:hypothetical protein RND71_020028 [Anisodus tanguticus]
MLIWAQNQLDEKAFYPRITNLSTASLEDPAVQNTIQVPFTIRIASLNRANARGPCSIFFEPLVAG